MSDERPDRAASSTQAPTDLELMLYADGELEGEALAAVEAHLARDPRARSKLRAMGIVGGVVRAEAMASAKGAEGIADLVMARIAAEAPAEPAVAPSAPPPRPALEPAAVLPRSPRPANHNGLWALAAAGIAAAAGLLLWGRGAPPVSGPVATGPTTTLTAPSGREPVGLEHGVEVAAVDFGAHSGAVFYVDSGSADSSTTTVVWLSDDTSGGNE